jgi:hypothetical protein
MVPRAPPTVTAPPVFRPDWKTLVKLAFTRSKPLDLDACPAPTSLRRFCGTTDKPKPTWFWATEQETVAVILRPKSTNQSCRFWGPNRKTLHYLGFEAQPRNWLLVLRPNQEKRRHQFWGQIGENRRHWFWDQTSENRCSKFWGQTARNHSSGFEAKPLTNRRPWFWGSTKKHALLVFTCQVQTAHCATWPLDRPATEYPTCATISDPLHQVSYSCHGPRCCTLCRICHLHTTRQANTILQRNKDKRKIKRNYSGFEFKSRQVNDSSQSNQVTNHLISQLL